MVLGHLAGGVMRVMTSCQPPPHSSITKLIFSWLCVTANMDRSSSSQRAFNILQEDSCTSSLIQIGLGIELQYFYGIDWTASILLKTEKCQASKFSIKWPNELISSASVSQYTCSILAVPRSNGAVRWLYSCVLQEKHQATRRNRADLKYV